ncbi:MAG: hypothetical protein WBU92_02580 [Candidatus Dormiibacterota bacterium]
MIRKAILIGGVAALAAAAPVTAVAASQLPARAAVATAQTTCTADQLRLRLHDGSGDGQQYRLGAPAGSVPVQGQAGYQTGPMDGTGEQHRGPAVS